MTEEIKNKIDGYVSDWHKDHQLAVESGAHYAYALAEQEIERLKAIIERCFKEGIPEYAQDSSWEHFEKQNNL